MATIKEAATLIAAIGAEVTPLLLGEPGIGKSSILPILEARFGDAYEYIYVDCPNLDLPEYGMPQVVKGVTSTAPNAMWRFDSQKPKIIMLDELTKAQPHMKPVLTTTMLERRVGTNKFPGGSIVFGTGNLTTDGVGDSMQGHIGNRVARVHVEKSSADIWLSWALNNDISATICAAVAQMPHSLASYVNTDGSLNTSQQDNLYIYNPKRPSQSTSAAFVSPRSLHKASHVLAQREVLGTALLTEVLEGVVGIAFARDLMAYDALTAHLPKWEDILAHPDKALVPTSTAAQWLLVFSSVPKVDATTAAALTTYFLRFDIEVRMTWARQFKDMGPRLVALLRIAAFKDMLIGEHWLFS